MHIHEVIIDGFKSYSTRTVVSGFDPHFNAITGLNGSGKSNILDSICFVLGISNLSQVRVGNLQELVYKQGQAGITKATVTVVFDNNDVATSPVGYESSKQITVTRQIAIGGKNKYMINGHTVQQQQVQNLFHSVQLNVNNPHFLIMQGRITKVLNMKPIEILSMIEEAAGTRMFETKKQAALKTIEKKQQKIDELSNIMKIDILPTLDKLRSERQCYMTWTANNADIELLSRLSVAYDYKEAVNKVECSENDRLSMVKLLEELQAEETSCEAQIVENDKKIGELLATRTGEFETNLAQKKKIADETAKELVKVDTACKNQKETLQAETDSKNSVQQTIDTATENISKKEIEAVAATEAVILKENEIKAAEEEVVSLREKYQKACAGVGDETNAEMLSVPEQIRTWEKVARESQSQLQQIAMKTKHAETALKSLNKDNKAQQAGYTKMVAEADKLKASIAKAEGEIASLSGSLNMKDEPAIRQRADVLVQEISNLKDKIDRLTTTVNAKLNFQFKSPDKNFDRNRVKGLVAKLVTVNDKKAATALEIAAGGKLYQVVVDNEQTGKLLLEKGQLQKRVTILPLNKINGRVMDGNRLKMAKDIATQNKGSAKLALELVGYDAEIQKAIEYVFGNVVICDTAAVAKSITFNKSIATRTVTLDGDVYEPGGTMSGGSKSQIGQLLSAITELAESQDSLDALNSEMKQVDKQIQQYDVSGSKIKDLLSAVDLKKEELQLCEDKISSTSYAQEQGKVKALENEILQYSEEKANLEAKVSKSKVELKKLESMEKNSQKQRENALKEMEKTVKNKQKEVNSLKTELNKLKHDRDLIVGEIESLKSDILAAQEQGENAEKEIARISAELEVLLNKSNEMRIDYDQYSTEVALLTAEITKCDKGITACEKAKALCSKTIQENSLEIRKLQHKLKQWEKDCKDAVRTVSMMEKQYPWIETDKQHFGVVGSDYDFTTYGADIKASRQKLQTLKAEQDRLAKKINKKVMGLIEKAETEAEELNRKKDVVLNDKAKIENVISELDVKKQQALQTTWAKVNRDFGSIFSTLLPGTMAKLDPFEGDVMNGLEVRVAFNGVWKDSLTELSGGQRSLLALSLILSLLLFKPAPMYILDEVDAALDLSHTQNIGLMLRTHFSHSQFIVVSLKEGMFNNANVIFRTRFVDGVSNVSRTVVGGKAPLAPSNSKFIKNSVENEEAPATKKSKSKSKKNNSDTMTL